MKFRIFIVVLLVAGAAFAGRVVNRMKEAGEGGSAREERRESFRLGAGARVEVRHVSGSVEIKTAETDAVEVHILRAAESTEDLEGQRIAFEVSPDALVIRGEGGRRWWRRLWGGGGEVRQELRLVVPRRAELNVRHVNGPVAIGETEGAVEVRHVNGRVEVAGVTGRAEVAHVNGGVKLGVSRLDVQGLEVRGVNGNVEVRLRERLDADIEVRGHNGGFAFEVPNVTAREREGRSEFRARLGAGGHAVNVRGVNGNLRFTSSAPAAAAAQSATATADATTLSPPPPPPPPSFR